MAIFGLDSEWFENLSLETRPKRHYLSASSGSILETGVTGSVYVFAERSKFEKEAQPLKAFNDGGPDVFDDDSVESFRNDMIASASLSDPVQIQQITELTFRTEDSESTLAGGLGAEGSFDYRDLLGHSSYKYINCAYFDLSEAYGTVRRFYFYNSSWGNSKTKPDLPDNGTLHMVDLKDLSSVGDPSLSPDVYDVASALDMVASATCAAVDSVNSFDATYVSDSGYSRVEITNVQYGTCEPPVTGVITNPFTGHPVLDLDLDADGVGDQDLPTFPYNIFDMNVATSGSATSINVMLDRYMGMVNDSEVSSRKQTAVSITRFEPSFKLTSDTLRKNVIKDVLFPYYRTKHSSLHWAFTNYNTINFFTSSMVPPDSAFIYPSITDETVQPSIIPYSPSGSFTFEFYINPRYTIDDVDSYASGSFVVKDWEKLFIDFHGGGRGAHDSSWWVDYFYQIDTDADGDPEWITASEAGYTGFYLLADNSDATVEDADPDGDGIPDQVDTDLDGVGDTDVYGAWTENEWYTYRNGIDPTFTRHENLITDKGDEAPDYDFRSGDPIIKNCRIICNDAATSPVGDQVFEFASPGNINNATDWTVGKNELGDFDNYATAINIAKTIDGNEYFKSWAEKVEIVDEDGQQRVNEAEELLWTDDNELNEYNVFDAIEKDFPDDLTATINSYQATSAGVLLWSTETAPVYAVYPDDPGNVLTALTTYVAADVGYGVIEGWTLEDVLLKDTAENFGYTGYYDKETTDDVIGPMDLDGNQYWYDLTQAPPNSEFPGTAVAGVDGYAIATSWNYSGYYDSSTTIRPDCAAADPNAVAWTEEEWASYRELTIFPGADNATQWSEQAWADYNEYFEVYQSSTAGIFTLIMPDEVEWMGNNPLGLPDPFTPVLVEYAVDPAAPTMIEQSNWALNQGYEAVIVYEPTKVYGRVWVQTLISGYDGNDGIVKIDTTQQREFTWYSWEDVPIDTTGDGSYDSSEWQWVENTESSSYVDEDAREAFAQTDANEFDWSTVSGPPDVYHTKESELDLDGGRDHIIVDRDRSHAFNAGTILHMSSSYAISLVTGSHIDPAGHPDTFRVMLQLSSSADIPPSEIPLYDPAALVPTIIENDQYGTTWSHASGINSNKIYLSSDNSLRRNHWHHIAIRWGTELIDDSKAQIIIDGQIDSEFNLPSDPYDLSTALDLSIPQEFGDAVPRKWEGLTYYADTDAPGDPGHGTEDTWVPIDDFSDTDIEADPAALFVGNYFEGKNGSSYSQTVSYLDSDGNPTIEGDHVSEVYAWYIQEIDADTAMGRWVSSAGIEVAAADISVDVGEVDKTDDSLRKAYFDAMANYTMDSLEYTPILSSTLAANLSGLGDHMVSIGYNPTTVESYMYDQVLTLDSDQTQYVQGFFSYEAAEQHGVTWGRLDDVDSESGWTADDPDPLEPNIYELKHPLNAEVHELKVWNEYRTLPQLWSSQKDGIEEIEETLLFYLPPFFVKETREREVMLTPFQTMKSTTDDPFNVAMSFGVGGHLLNLENFSREFVKGEYPLLMNLTGSTIDTTTQEEKEANEFLNDSPGIRKRNLTILPCDNGFFVPDFTILASGSYESKPGSDHETSKFVNDYGSIDYGMVSLRDMVPEEMMYPGLIAVDAAGEDDTSADSIFAAVAGSTPENPGVAPGSVLAILQRTRDTSSNEVVFFDVSNLFYGKKITPKSFELIDHDVTGSGGKVKVTLKDNGHGLLYRADADTKHPLWSSVGNLIYEEGIAIVHNPCIPYFGKEQFEVNLAGHHNIHIMEILVPCNQGQINSSSNPRYESLQASTFASEEDTEFVYITGLNFHDENLNIVARTSLAQPIMKRDADNLSFRVKVDF